MNFYIDCEFNGYLGELISMALVGNDGSEFYEAIYFAGTPDTWVEENVLPVVMKPVLPLCTFQRCLAKFLKPYAGQGIHIIADWPDDIKYFCQMLITGPGTAIPFPNLTLEINRDLNADASLTPHNALADARAIQACARSQ